MRKYDNLPINRLVSDVAVDPVHVRELADSIKVSGPISPVLVRDETLELIDGFHRVAAMRELGFDNVECIITPCDQETFWDLRIISATLHKAVTFARAVDWIDEAFAESHWKNQYKSAYNIFNGVRQGYVTGEAKAWVEAKGTKWGLTVGTIENWLQAKQTLAPELREELRTSTAASRREPSQYIEIAHALPTRPELQKRVLDKVEREGLSTKEIREVSKAIRSVADEEEVETILREPVSRTADELTRAAKVEKILKQPPPEPTPREREQLFRGLLLEVYLDVQQMAHSVRRVKPEILEPLTPNQKSALLETTEELIAELQRVADYLRGRPLIEGEARLIKEAE